MDSVIENVEKQIQSLPRVHKSLQMVAIPIYDVKIYEHDYKKVKKLNRSVSN